jgi:hypothetical protein
LSGRRQHTDDEIIQALQRTNGLVSLAAREIRATPQMIYKRIRISAAVKLAVDEARESMIDLAELKLRQAVMNGEPYAVSLVLKTIGKNRGYVERQEVTGADGAAIKVIGLGVDTDKL